MFHARRPDRAIEYLSNDVTQYNRTVLSHTCSAMHRSAFVSFLLDDEASAQGLSDLAAAAELACAAVRTQSECPSTKGTHSRAAPTRALGRVCTAAGRSRNRAGMVFSNADRTLGAHRVTGVAFLGCTSPRARQHRWRRMPKSACGEVWGLHFQRSSLHTCAQPKVYHSVGQSAVHAKAPHVFDLNLPQSL